MRRYDSNGQVYSPPHKFLASFLTLTFIMLLLIGAVAQLIWLNGHSLRSVSGASMRPLLNNYVDTDTGDMVLISKRDNVTYNDIVVFTDKTDEDNKQLIKRVIALPGDKVDMELVPESKSVNVYVNDTLLDEPYVIQAEDDNQFSALTQKYVNFKQRAGWLYWENKTEIESTERGGIVVPEGCMFCLGDNRIDSYDSRSFGPVPIEWCEGIVEGILLKDSFYTQVLSTLYGLM